MYVHGITEVPDDPLGALPARFLFIGIASFAVQHLLIADGHAASADPVLAVAGVNMVEIGQRGILGVDTLSEYQIGCRLNPNLIN